jgi:uncharacterized membrane protein
MFSPVIGSRYFLSVVLCALVGAGASGIALQHHYRRDGSSFCNFGMTFNCDVVNRSSYSQVQGIPVALAGLIAYGVMIALAMFQRDKAETPALLLLLSGTGLLFSLYLTYVEAVVLRTWCILCLTSLFSIALIAMFSALCVHGDLRGARS